MNGFDLSDIQRRLDHLKVPQGIDTTASWPDWKRYLDSLKAEGYRIDSVTFETRGPV